MSEAREWEAEAAALWSAGELSAAEIGRKFGVTKNTIISLAHRRVWIRLADGSARTLDDRLDAVWTKFRATLKECDRLMAISRRKFAAGRTNDDSDQRDQAAD